ncbi:MAG TPA: alpha/beta hydrolase [Candidatus Binatia bacterium]|nr:alpha/beta hydrolase [Candidatus Binatia bacterium]
MRLWGCASARPRELVVRGLRLHLLEWGEPGRPALAFLHGGSAHAHWFDAVAPAFADRFHVVALDQRGHGLSAWPRPAAYATEDFAADLLGVLDGLGWERAVITGHSMGGHVAMAFAAWHPERVRALVVIDARPSIPEERLRRMQERARRPPRRHASREDAVAAFRLLPPETRADPALLAHLAEQGVAPRDGGWAYRFDPDTARVRRPADGWRLLDRIPAPALVVRGEWSPILPRDLAAEMVAKMPRARLVEIPGTYHHLVLDDPAAFVRALDQFLGELPS